MTKHKPIIITVLASAAILLGLGLLDNMRGPNSLEIELDDTSEISLDGPLTPEEQEISNPINTNTMNPTAVITTNMGVIELELFETEMPITVGNFIMLAESDFYTNTKFHRVIDNFMIQGGDPNSKSENPATYGTGGSDNIQDEFVAGEFLTNTRGTIAMANTGQPNSGSSQFFINLVDNTGLDFDKEPFSSKHPVFGRVVKGMDIVDMIGKVNVQPPANIPVDPVIVESVEIVRN